MKRIILIQIIVMVIVSNAYAAKPKSECQCWGEAFATMLKEHCAENLTIDEVVGKSLKDAAKNSCTKQMTYESDKAEKIYGEMLDYKKWNGCDAPRKQLINKYISICAD